MEIWDHMEDPPDPFPYRYNELLVAGFEGEPSDDELYRFAEDFVRQAGWFDRGWRIVRREIHSLESKSGYDDAVFFEMALEDVCPGSRTRAGSKSHPSACSGMCAL